MSAARLPAWSGVSSSPPEASRGVIGADQRPAQRLRVVANTVASSGQRLADLWRHLVLRRARPQPMRELDHGAHRLLEARPRLLERRLETEALRLLLALFRFAELL